MLDKQDLQAISQLLDEKLDQKLKIQKEEITAEIGASVNAGFNYVEDRFNKIEEKIESLTEEMAKRPTRNEIFSWADRRIDDLELRADRHDYLHINEIDSLPSQREISQALLDHGLKKTA